MNGSKFSRRMIVIGCCAVGVVGLYRSTITIAADSAPANAAPAGAEAWKAELHPEMKMVLDELASMNGKPIESLTPEEARKQPSIADAAKSIMQKKNMPMPQEVGKVQDRVIPRPDGSIPARVYIPKGSGPFPVIVYYHGGGWVIATMDTYDSSARALCNAAEAVVVAIEYRKAPENKFPAAHEDAFAAYKWALQNAGEIDGKTSSVSVAGESAGGNMAAAVCLMAKERNVALPSKQILIYPLTQVGMETPSIQKYADAKPLNKPMLGWFGKHTVGKDADKENPMLNLLKATDLKGLPPATIITAQIDPLNSEGKMYADKLKDAGVDVRYKNYEGVTHEFFGLPALLPEAKDAVNFAASAIK